MKFSLDAIMEGVEFVSSDPEGESDALLSLATGEIFYRSPNLDDEGIDAQVLPADIDDAEKYLALPHRTDLDLGPQLAIDFVAKMMPQAEMDIRAMFRKRGAFASFKPRNRS